MVILGDEKRFVCLFGGYPYSVLLCSTPLYLLLFLVKYPLHSTSFNSPLEVGATQFDLSQTFPNALPGFLKDKCASSTL